MFASPPARKRRISHAPFSIAPLYARMRIRIIIPAIYMCARFYLLLVKPTSHLLSPPKVGFSWKVKIPRDCLHAALSSASPHSHYVCIWRNNAKTQVPLHMPQNHPTQSKSFDSLGIVAWNCRGILTSIPYIQHLITVGSLF